MGTKNNPAPNDCYANALPDEPLFTLLARDPVAPTIVRSWAQRREVLIDQGKKPESDRAIVAEARLCAQHMEAWREANDGAWRTAVEVAPARPATRGARV